jgi:hypothetical protein
MEEASAEEVPDEQGDGRLKTRASILCRFNQRYPGTVASSIETELRAWRIDLLAAISQAQQFQ